MWVSTYEANGVSGYEASHYLYICDLFSHLVLGLGLSFSTFRKVCLYRKHMRIPVILRLKKIENFSLGLVFVRFLPCFSGDYVQSLRFGNKEERKLKFF